MEASVAILDRMAALKSSGIALAERLGQDAVKAMLPPLIGQPVSPLAAIHLLVDLLEGLERSCDDLLASTYEPDLSLQDRDAGVVLQRSAGVRAFIDHLEAQELALIAKLTRARVWAELVGNSDERLARFANLFHAGSTALSELAPRLADPVEELFATGGQQLSFLMARGIISDVRATADGSAAIHVHPHYLVCGIAPLGDIAAMVTSTLNALDAHYSLYEADAELDGDDDDSLVLSPAQLEALGLESPEEAPSAGVEVAVTVVLTSGSLAANTALDGAADTEFGTDSATEDQTIAEGLAPIVLAAAPELEISPVLEVAELDSGSTLPEPDALVTVGPEGPASVSCVSDPIGNESSATATQAIPHDFEPTLAELEEQPTIDDVSGDDTIDASVEAQATLSADDAAETELNDPQAAASVSTRENELNSVPVAEMLEPTEEAVLDLTPAEAGPEASSVAVATDDQPEQPGSGFDLAEQEREAEDAAADAGSTQPGSSVEVLEADSELVPAVAELNAQTSAAIPDPASTELEAEVRCYGPAAALDQQEQAGTNSLTSESVSEPALTASPGNWAETEEGAFDLGAALPNSEENAEPVNRSETSDNAESSQPDFVAGGITADDQHAATEAPALDDERPAAHFAIEPADQPIEVLDDATGILTDAEPQDELRDSDDDAVLTLGEMQGASPAATENSLAHRLATLVL
jgi:hypothetical protein